MSTKQERFQRIDAAVFRVISDADWAAALRRERRGVPNAVHGQIHQKILDLNLGKSESGNVGKKSTG